MYTLVRVIKDNLQALTPTDTFYANKERPDIVEVLAFLQQNCYLVTSKSRFLRAGFGFSTISLGGFFTAGITFIGYYGYYQGTESKDRPNQNTFVISICWCSKGRRNCCQGRYCCGSYFHECGSHGVLPFNFISLLTRM